jgi:signal transduction histidine kinase
MNIVKVILILQLALGLVNIGRAQSKSILDDTKINQAKDKIQYYLNQKEYAKSGYLYDTLAGLYDAAYGFNKYTIDAYFKARKQFGIIKDSSMYFHYNIMIANYYLKDDFFNKRGYNLHQLALTFYRKHNYHNEIASCMIGLAYHYIRGGESMRTEEHLFETLKVAKQTKRPDLIANAYSLLTNYYFTIKDMQAGVPYADTSWNISNNNNITWLKSLTLFYRGLYQEYHGNPYRAIELFNQATLFADSTMQFSLKRDILKHLAHSYELIGLHKIAYAILYKHLDVVGQLHQSERTQNIRLVETNEKINSLVREKNEARQIQFQKQNALNQALLALTILVALVFVLFVWIYMQKKINKQRELLSQKQLATQKLEALINGQEQERQRLSLELHDGLGSLLARSKLFVSFNVNMHYTNLSEYQNLLTTLEQQLDDACEAVREISHGLEPFTLSRFGLHDALIDLVHSLQRVTNAEIQLHYNWHGILQTNAQFMIYRIIQELLNNAIKHSNAKNISVQLALSTNSRCLMIQVEDDGKGFDFHSVYRGNGLNNIMLRIAFLKGTVNWLKKYKEGGTSIQINIPFL